MIWRRGLVIAVPRRGRHSRRGLHEVASISHVFPVPSAYRFRSRLGVRNYRRSHLGRRTDRNGVSYRTDVRESPKNSRQKPSGPCYLPRLSMFPLKSKRLHLLARESASCRRSLTTGIRVFIGEGLLVHQPAVNGLQQQMSFHTEIDQDILLLRDSCLSAQVIHQFCSPKRAYLGP